MATTKWFRSLSVFDQSTILSYLQQYTLATPKPHQPLMDKLNAKLIEDARREQEERNKRVKR